MDIEKFLEILVKDPEIASTLIPSLTEKYKSTLYTFGNEILNIIKDYSENTEYFTTVAKIKKQQFDAYVNVGFSEDQAIAFIINDNIKLMENIKKNVSKINNKK